MSIIKKKIKDKNGSIAIIGVILALIIVTIITAYVNITNSSWVVNEVQSIMDLSNTNALQLSVDSDMLKKEMLAIEQKNYVTSDGHVKVNQDMLNKIVGNNLKAQLANNIKTSSLIDSVQIKYIKPELLYTNWGLNYDGNKEKARPQLILDSVVQVTLKHSKEFDNLDSKTIKTYNARTGNDIQISVDGKSGDGKVVLTVRSLTRMVYR